MNPPIIKDPPLGRSGLAKLVAELKRQGRICEEEPPRSGLQTPARGKQRQEMWPEDTE